jgi:hypothetical protein
MTAALADPLINGMAIRRVLPVLGQSSMWQTAGAAVVVTPTRAPLLTGGSELDCMRRGQAVLDALTCFGLPVRARADRNLTTTHQWTAPES